MIDSVLAAGLKSRYSFVYSTSADASGRYNTYTLNANPTVAGTTGTNYYFTDQTGVIRQNSTAAAAATDSPSAGSDCDGSAVTLLLFRPGSWNRVRGRNAGAQVGRRVGPRAGSDGAAVQTMLAVETDGLTKDYTVGFWRRRPKRALDGLSLRIEPSEVFGLLGPNGAGKSTTLKILIGLVFPTSGQARILGSEVRDLGMHERIGYLPENPYFYDHLTAEEFLSYAAQLLGLRGAECCRRVDHLLERTRLGDSCRTPLGKFSKGMVQRLGIAQALVNEPDVLILDQPMSGLDPLGRREVRDLILELKAEGKAVLFSTHVLSDAEPRATQRGRRGARLWRPSSSSSGRR